MSRKILWIDTETTGTDPQRHGIIQISGIVEVDGIEKESFDFHVRTFGEDLIENTALSVNGITREQIAGFPTPREVRASLVEIMSLHVNQYDRADKFVFAGYNAQSDINFMHSFFRKCGDAYFGSWIWWPGLDVSVLAMQRLMNIRHTLPNFKLSTLAAHFGIPSQGEAHDALSDIRMTKAIYRHMFPYAWRDEQMNISIDDIDHFRTIAEIEKTGIVDEKCWGEEITPYVVIALCDKVEQLTDAIKLIYAAEDRLEREAAELAIIAANQALGRTLEDLGLDSSGLMHPPTPEMIREFVQEGLLEVLP